MMSATGAGLVWSFFFGGRLVTNLPAAWLVGRIGARWTASFGALCILTGSALAAIADRDLALFAARLLQGAGVALIVNAGLFSLLRAWPGRGAAMTAFNVGAGVGTSAGLLASGPLTVQLGWRSIFWFCAGIGAVLLTATILARSRSAPAVAKSNPVERLDRPLPASWRIVAAPLATNLLVYANYSIWVVSLSLYLTRRFEADSNQISLILLALNFAHLAATIPVGWAIRRAGSRAVLSAGFGITATGLMLALMAPSPLWLLAPLTLYAFGEMAGNSGAGDLLLRLGGGGQRAVGMVRLTSDLGLVIGPALAGLLVDLAGVGAPFLVLAALSAMASVLLGRSSIRTKSLA
jgi:MFS family permease